MSISQHPFHGRWPLHVTFPQFDGFVILQSGGGYDIFRGMASAAEDDVRVSLKSLNDLFCLQIPNIDLVVFTAADDPFPAGDGKVGENAIFFVLVALVGLEAFAFGVVPQL